MRNLKVALFFLLLTALAMAGRFDGNYVMYGAINNKYQISMEITIQGGNVYGNYGYDSQTGKLVLNGTIDAQGNVVMYESDNRGQRTGIFRGTIDPEGGGISGTWSSPDGRTAYPFFVEEPRC